jgi:predicted SnoaL-like aldol condensation-catalyzing enzyme
MKIFWFLILTAVINVNANQNKLIIKSNGENVEKSNNQKVVELLKSIESGAQEPAGYINQNKYIQHNQGVADGLSGFGEILGQLAEAAANNPSLTPKANTVRVFADGDYVVAHTEYNFFGPKIGFDIFRFEDGLIVEHWDNLQETVTETASGRTQTDGPTEVTDFDKTEANKELIRNLVNDVFFGANPNKITDYISAEKYEQHNPAVKDGIAGFGEALKSLAEAGMPMVFEKNHLILGEGNFVLSVTEGIFMKEKVAFYDLFRIENGMIVEHWDTIQTILPETEAKNSNGKFGF